MTLSTSIIILISLLPTIIWFMIYYKKDKVEPEPIRLLALSFLLGMLSAFILMGMEYIIIRKSGISLVEHLESKNIGQMGIILILAGLEELLKGTFLFNMMVTNCKQINQHIDGIMYGISIALGFAFVENIAYFMSLISIMSESQMMLTYTFRTLGTMFAHTLFTGLFGYFLTFCMIETNEEHTIATFVEDYFFSVTKCITSHLTLKSLRHHIFDKKEKHGLYHPFDVFVESLLLIILFHFMFNLLVSTNIFDKNYIFLSVPFLFALGTYVFKRFKDQRILPTMEDT